MGISSNKRNREGVALILVVGMLALLMVMGVSFAVFMRTERIAAGNFRNDVQARQLLHVALARAMGDIEFRASVSNAHYPEWLVLASSNAVGNMVTNSAWATNYIPWGAVDASLDNVQWIDVGQAGCSGRIAYACINASGLLDINYAGAGTRASGTNASEIQIHVLSEVQNAADLVGPRSIKPYETLQDVNTAGAAGLREAARSFITYSANPKSYTNGAAESWVDIEGDVADPLKKSGIVGAFKASVKDSSDADAEFMYNNLLDYVDADHIPKDLGSPCTESVPMINEVNVAVTNYFYGAGPKNGKYSLQTTVNIEWAYPFVKTNPALYSLDYDISFSSIGGTPDEFVPNPIKGIVDTGYSGVQADCGQCRTLPSPLIDLKTGTYTNLLGMACKFGVTLRLAIREGSGPGGAIVDAVPYPVAGLPFSFTNNAGSAPSSVQNTNVGWMAEYEAIDPRFNWSCVLAPASVAQWRKPLGVTSTLGSVNSWVTNEWASPNDGFFDMYVADRQLMTAAELTYLVRGISRDKMWNTIRLTSQTGVGGFQAEDAILDYFVVGSSNNIRNGVVNPNTRSVQVMKSLFEGMPLEKYPGDSAASTIDTTSAERLATWWMSTENNVFGSVSNLSQIGQMTNVYSDVVFSGKTPFEKEAFFRNLVGLLGVRQNYFVILLYAQAIKVTPDGQQNASAECRAVAEVWRDARPNAEGKHPCKVRLLKILPNP